MINSKIFSHSSTESFEYVANQLRRPFNLAFRDFVDLTQKWQPGAHRQARNSRLELIHRICLIFTFITRLTFGLNLWLIGSFLASITCLSKKEFTFVDTQEKPVIDEVDPSHLRVLTYNVCLGPEWMVAINKLRSTAERIPKVAKTILKSGCDVVCLQEVFDEPAAQILKSKLKSKGYRFFLYNVGPSSWKLNSGLFIASKYPISKPKYWKFKSISGWDAYSGKGVLGATIQVGKKSIALFNTHLNGPGKNSDKIREKQLGEFLEHVNEYVSENQLENRLIGCGDFNEPNLGDILSRLDEKKLAPVAAKNKVGTLFDIDQDLSVGRKDSSFMNWKLVEGPVDYILAPTSKQWIRPLRARISRGEGASDHLSVKSTFSLVPQEPKVVELKSNNI